MSLPSYARDFRGHPACPCLIAWLPVYERLLQHEGALTGPLPIMQLIGGAAASAGTHTKGGAWDTHYLGVEPIALARQMGADATWHRPYGWDSRGGSEHTHGVLSGCPHNGPAAYQIVAVRDGFNGLGHLGRGGKDTGPRPLSGRTWQQGIEWAEEQMALSEEDVQRIADAVWAKTFAAAGGIKAGTLLRAIGKALKVIE